MEFKVNVDIDEYDILEKFSTKDLIYELEARMDIKELAEQLTDEELKDEVANRELLMTEEGPSAITVTPYNLDGEELRRFLCDVVSSGYYISNEELIDKIKNKL